MEYFSKIEDENPYVEGNDKNRNKLDGIYEKQMKIIPVKKYLTYLNLLKVKQLLYYNLIFLLKTEIIQIGHIIE